jgi:nitrite reductase/ring-hydroxylating ferredoxin subunit
MSSEARRGEGRGGRVLSRQVVGKARELPPGHSRSLWAAGRRVAMFNRAGRLFAMDAACPHMGADLGNGTVSGGTLTCAWHQWQFDLESGKGLTRRWACLKMHRLSQEGEDLVLEIDDPPSEIDDSEGGSAADEPSA